MFMLYPFQRVLLPLDITALPAAEPGVLGLAHLIERLTHVAWRVELVKEESPSMARERSSATLGIVISTRWPRTTIPTI